MLTKKIWTDRLKIDSVYESANGQFSRRHYYIS